MAVIGGGANTITRPKTLQPTFANHYTPGSKRKKRPNIPIIISLNPSTVNLNDLSSLFKSCSISPHRFPDDRKVEPVNVGKLGVAISHSSVVVSAFCREDYDEDDDGRRNGLWGRVAGQLTPENGRLVGFGRAVSDLGLTASIHDVMVLPSLRRMGIGRLIIQRILRVLKNRGVYDISALCSEDERPFFEACGFGDDILGATTMMYGKIALDSGDHLVVQAGRKLLLAPPPRQML